MFTPARRGGVLKGCPQVIVLHEVGHALVDIHDLPVTGLEEDAVDQFSALIQSRTYGGYDPDYEAGQIMMLDVAEWWGYDSQEGPPATGTPTR